MNAATAAAEGGRVDGDTLESAVTLCTGQFERLRADALGQLGRLQAGNVSDEELADLIEQADVVGVEHNMRWDCRVLMQLRALRLILHRPVLPDLEDLCVGLVEPGYARRRLLQEITDCGVFDGLDQALRSAIATWAPDLDWHAAAATLGAILDERFRNRTHQATRARPNVRVSRMPAAAAGPERLDPARWSRRDIAPSKVVQRLSRLVGHLFDQLLAQDRSGVSGSSARRMLVQLGCLDGWLRPDRALVDPAWIERLRGTEALTGATAVRSWPEALRTTVRVKFSHASKVPAGKPAAALAMLLWRHQALDESVIAQLLGLQGPVSVSDLRGTSQCAVWREEDRSSPRQQDLMPRWLADAADRALADGRLSGGRALVLSQALHEMVAMRGRFEATFGPRSPERLLQAFRALRLGQRERFVFGGVETALVETAGRLYGSELRAAFERIILLEAATVRLFTLSDARRSAPGAHVPEVDMYRHLESVGGRRTAELVRQAVAAAGSRARISQPSPGSVQVAFGV